MRYLTMVFFIITWALVVPHATSANKDRKKNKSKTAKSSSSVKKKTKKNLKKPKMTGKKPASSAVVEKPKVDINQEINSQYLKTLEPIFKKKCFDCHSDQTVYPWYHSIPGVKQLIDSDITDAKKHLDMTKGYPFKSDDSQMEILEDLEEVIKEDEMPLWRYRVMHGDSSLTEEEKTAIQQWIDSTKSKLKAAGLVEPAEKPTGEQPN